MVHPQEHQAQPTSGNPEADADVNTALRNALTLHEPPHKSIPFQHDHLTISLPPPSTPFIKIGAGTCGAVFAQPQSPLAFKLSKTTNHSALWNDYTHHIQIFNELTRSAAYLGVAVPQPHYFVPAGHKHAPWAETHSNLLRTASEFVNLPTSVPVSERIPLCPPALYLGSMLGKDKNKRQLPVFSLRNFNLHLNQMGEIGLDYKVLAARIGKAMAVLHGVCGNDAGDVEFVLGGRRHVVGPGRDVKWIEDKTGEEGEEGWYTGPESCQDGDLFQPGDNSFFPSGNPHDEEEVALWLLDFNRVKAFDHKESDGRDVGLRVDAMVRAARENDPYLPRRGPQSQERERPITEEEYEAWVAFRRGYEQVAGNYGDARDSEINPERQFLDDWEEVPRRVRG
ncbi:hypothetical protein B0T21DRAFT_409385 [Apiosordaria backusii]|uniref:DUF3669 domain-containing protein n=1 Tax=Apiosordaria backusii TaxID=314023 RepID=A0AA40BRC5_9PEZI|nr:hypothetical protein B0T21DRAFT_409385 [Apiosordaria backusii]